MPRSSAFTVALLLALAIVTLWWQLSEKRARTLNTRVVAAERHAVALEDSMRATRVLRDGGPAVPGVSRERLRMLRALGFSDPARQLSASLADHRELIPFPGVLGGTMIFDPSSVVLMDGPWVFAQFEDGHVLGYGVFEYSVARGGHISWKRVTAKME